MSQTIEQLKEELEEQKFKLRDVEYGLMRFDYIKISEGKLSPLQLLRQSQLIARKETIKYKIKHIKYLIRKGEF